MNDKNSIKKTLTQLGKEAGEENEEHHFVGVGSSCFNPTRNRKLTECTHRLDFQSLDSDRRNYIRRFSFGESGASLADAHSSKGSFQAADSELSIRSLFNGTAG